MKPDKEITFLESNQPHTMGIAIYWSDNPHLSAYVVSGMLNMLANNHQMVLKGAVKSDGETCCADSCVLHIKSLSCFTIKYYAPLNL